LSIPSREANHAAQAASIRWTTSSYDNLSLMHTLPNLPAPEAIVAAAPRGYRLDSRLPADVRLLGMIPARWRGRLSGANGWPGYNNAARRRRVVFGIARSAVNALPLSLHRARQVNDLIEACPGLACPAAIDAGPRERAPAPAPVSAGIQTTGAAGLQAGPPTSGDSPASVSPCSQLQSSSEVNARYQYYAQDASMVSER
jgi:hypothetical protein